MSDQQLKPNSDKSRSNRAEVTEEAREIKKNGFRNFLMSILPKNSSSFLRHVIRGIIAPRTIDMVDDVLKDGIDRWLHPDDRRYYDDRRRDSRDGVTYRDYDSLYESPRNSRSYEPEYRDINPDPRTIVFRRRETADIILEEMRDIIREKRFCTIGEFYTIAKKVTEGGINITPNFTDEKFGWSDLGGVRAQATYDGKWAIRFPRTEHI